VRWSRTTSHIRNGTNVDDTEKEVHLVPAKAKHVQPKHTDVSGYTTSVVATASTKPVLTVVSETGPRASSC